MEHINKKPNDRIQAILDKIKKNELTIRPKTYFRLKMIISIILAVFVFITSIFLCSFILFTLRASGEAVLLGFGPSGFTVFLLLFPWNLLVIDLVFIGALGWLLRSYRFGYKVPVLYLLFAVLTILVVSGYILDRDTPLHDQLLQEADNAHLPRPFNTMYENVRYQGLPPTGHGIFRGTVLSINGSVLKIAIENATATNTKAFMVDIPRDLHIDDIEVGDRVFIAGSISNNDVKVVSIHRAQYRQ